MYFLLDLLMVAVEKQSTETSVWSLTPTSAIIYGAYTSTKRKKKFGWLSSYCNWLGHKNCVNRVMLAS